MVDWDRIENFVGYGRRDAPVVFVGMEEGLKSPDELDSDLAARSAYAEDVMDLEVAHRGIAGAEKLFDPERARKQPTWRVMADLMLRRAHPEATPTGKQRKAYRALHLGRAHGDTLLAELLPYPHPKISDWLYERFGRFRTRENYLHAMLPLRRRLLRRVIAEAPRELIVCYGKAHWPYYQDLFDGVNWSDQSRCFRVGQIGPTRLVLTTHLSGRDFNSDVQLAEFARVTVEDAHAKTFR